MYYIVKEEAEETNAEIMGSDEEVKGTKWKD